VGDETAGAERQVHKFSPSDTYELDLVELGIGYAMQKDTPAVRAKGKQCIREQSDYIESLIAKGRDWAVPGGYSIVDPYILVFFRWGRQIGLEFEMASLFPPWTRLSSRVAVRPAVRRVFEQEGIDLG
jgi:glutathione S-transferase